MYLITYSGSGLGCSQDQLVGKEKDIRAKVNPKHNQVLLTRNELPRGSAEFWFIENGELKYDGLAETAAVESEGKAALEASCRAYQKSKIPSEDFTLYNIYKTPKALECIDWVDALWTLYFTAKASKDWGFNFSVHGEAPHKFVEVRAEGEA